MAVEKESETLETLSECCPALVEWGALIGCSRDQVISDWWNSILTDPNPWPLRF
jgi:hypothetical protein